MTLKIKKVPIDSIFEDPNNARKHGQKNLSAIKGSLAKFGQVEPLLVKHDTRIIIGGNGRHRAMKEMGMTEVDVVEIDITNFDATALSLALNKTAELAEWDTEILDKTLESLSFDGFDVGAFGFDDKKEFVPDLRYKNEKKSNEEYLKLIVSFENIDDQQDLFDELISRGFKVKI